MGLSFAPGGKGPASPPSEGPEEGGQLEGREGGAPAFPLSGTCYHPSPRQKQSGGDERPFCNKSLGAGDGGVASGQGRFTQGLHALSAGGAAFLLPRPRHQAAPTGEAPSSAERWLLPHLPHRSFLPKQCDPHIPKSWAQPCPWESPVFLSISWHEHLPSVTSYVWTICPFFHRLFLPLPFASSARCPSLLCPH